MSTSSRTSLFLVSAMACWGLGTVLSKYALGGFPSLVLLPVELLSSVTFLAVVLLIRGERIKVGSTTLKTALLGVLNPGLAYALGLLGLAYIDASVSVVLWATEPVLITLLAFVVLHEIIGWRTALLLSVAMAGVLLIVGSPTGTASFAGVVLTMAAVAACALYSVLLRKLRLTDGTISIVLLQQGAALAFALLLFSVIAPTWGLAGFSPEPLHIAAAISSGVIYYGAAFWFYVSGLRRTTAINAGLYLTLVPVFGIAMSYVLLGERFDFWQLGGAVLVIGAVVVLTAGVGKVGNTTEP